MSYGVYVKGDKRREAQTPKEMVNLEARGWRRDPEVKQPPAPDHSSRPTVDNPPPPPPPVVPGEDVPPAEAGDDYPEENKPAVAAKRGKSTK